ncbi:MAG TPA: carboxymuconolactone decarboxylase family protein [Thermodesulfobacteriota bacterium]
MTQRPQADKNPEALLAEVRAKRGYLLPHHGLLAVTDPKLLRAYDEMYTAMTLDTRVLDARTRELVWVGILVTVREVHGTQHLDRATKAGATGAEVDAAIRLAALAAGAPALRFVEASWARWLPAFRAGEAYEQLYEAVASRLPLEPRVAELVAAASHACLGHDAELAIHIRRAYGLGIPEPEIAEALSYIMFPAGVPAFVSAAQVWRGLVARGEVNAGPAVRAWAQA